MICYPILMDQFLWYNTDFAPFGELLFVLFWAQAGPSGIS